MKNRDSVRAALNAIFMLLALIGLLVYFAFPAHHLVGLAIIGVGMLAKIVEFFIRFMF